MDVYTWGGFTVEVDGAVTRNWYGTSPVWDCTCGHCRNFVELARRRELPTAVLSLLDKLSIPAEKASYVCELCHKDGRLYYQVAYRLSGRVRSGPGKGFVPIGDVGIFCGEENAPGTADGFPAPCFDLEFDLWLPWVLDEPIDGRPNGEEGYG